MKIIDLIQRKNVLYRMTCRHCGTIYIEYHFKRCVNCGSKNVNVE